MWRTGCMTSSDRRRKAIEKSSEIDQQKIFLTIFPPENFLSRTCHSHPTSSPFDPLVRSLFPVVVLSRSLPRSPRLRLSAATMIGSRILRNGLRAPALRTAAFCKPPSAFQQHVRHNSEKVKGTVIGIGISSRRCVCNGSSWLTAQFRSRNDKLVCCYDGRQDAASAGEQRG
jgi:hypothetical protein